MDGADSGPYLACRTAASGLLYDQEPARLFGVLRMSEVETA